MKMQNRVGDGIIPSILVHAKSTGTSVDMRFVMTFFRNKRDIYVLLEPAHRSDAAINIGYHFRPLVFVPVRHIQVENIIIPLQLTSIPINPVV